MDAMAGICLQAGDASDQNPPSVRVARVLFEQRVAEKGCDVRRLPEFSRRSPGALFQRRRAAVMAQGRRE
eukprot:15209446-Alexandrium_andersonii.AAC.1